MKPLYDRNGLMFWGEHDIRLRESFRDYFAEGIREALRETNPAWRFIQIEAPLLTPATEINSGYGAEDMYTVGGDLVLRPETTPGSYRWLRTALDDSGSGVKPPVCVWQFGKSFRREQDQVTKNMRLKEFYQQEFQCVFTEDSANDYHRALQAPVAALISRMVRRPTVLVPSERLPTYSRSTIDVEVDGMEVCSMSLRTDFPGKFRQTKGLLVAEIAIGLDRCVYQFNRETL